MVRQPVGTTKNKIYTIPDAIPIINIGQMGTSVSTSIQPKHAINRVGLFLDLNLSGSDGVGTSRVSKLIQRVRIWNVQKEMLDRNPNFKPIIDINDATIAYASLMTTIRSQELQAIGGAIVNPELKEDGSFRAYFGLSLNMIPGDYFMTVDLNEATCLEGFDTGPATVSGAIQIVVANDNCMVSQPESFISGRKFETSSQFDLPLGTECFLMTSGDKDEDISDSVSSLTMDVSLTLATIRVMEEEFNLLARTAGKVGEVEGGKGSSIFKPIVDPDVTGSVLYGVYRSSDSAYQTRVTPNAQNDYVYGVFA
jgi:stage V sporulation protein SpoVS